MRFRAFIPNIKNIPRRARNDHPLPVQENVINPLIPPIMHLDAIELARTMTMAVTESDGYKKPRDIIEHAKKCGAYNFYDVLNLGQVDKWIRTVEKAFNTLQLSDEKKMSNIYSLMFDKANDCWLELRTCLVKL